MSEAHMGELFSIVVTILIAGFLWFWIVRPILEDYGVIERRAVKDYQEAEPRVMSRPTDSAPVYPPSSLQTDNRRSTDRPAPAVPSRDVMLDTFRLLRKYGIPREEARPVVKALGLPLDNNLWTDAAPPEDEHRTPIVGRPTSAKFETDADYPYQPIKN